MPLGKGAAKKLANVGASVMIKPTRQNFIKYYSLAQRFVLNAARGTARRSPHGKRARKSPTGGDRWGLHSNTHKEPEVRLGIIISA
jgi:hypothetical protein